MLNQEAEQDAKNLATETSMDFLAAREKEQQKLATDAAGRSQIQSIKLAQIVQVFIFGSFIAPSISTGRASVYPKWRLWATKVKVYRN